jgi:ADP-ribosylglycohydrolase
MRTAGCVLYLLKWHRDVFESLKECIRMGGDVDSLGAIVVGILGTYRTSDHPTRHEASLLMLTHVVTRMHHTQGASTA